MYTIHNLQYQGVFGTELLKDLLGSGDDLFGTEGIEFYGAGSCMKGGLRVCGQADDRQPDLCGGNSDRSTTARSWTAYCASGPTIWSASSMVSIPQPFDPMNDPALDVPYRGSIAAQTEEQTRAAAGAGLDANRSRRRLSASFRGWLIRRALI